MPRESFRLPIKAKSWGVLERRLDDQNYDSLTKSTKQKEETKKKNDDVNDVSVTDAKLDKVDDTDINMNDDDTIHDNDNNQLNERTEHGIQTTYGDRNGLWIINYCNED